MEFDESFLGHGIHTFDEFKFENGSVLKDVNVEYFIMGTPKYDDDGNLINAIVYCHNYEGNCFSLKDLYQLTDEGAPFDKNEYFIISLTSLGFPDSCSPSSTGLRFNFPNYSVNDAVNFKKQFLKEFLNVENILGVVGGGLGGFAVYAWACEYPDDMEFIIVRDSSFKTAGYRYAISKAIEDIIVSSDGFYSEGYDVSLSNTLVSINKLVYSNYFSRNYFQKMSNDEIDVLMDDFVEEGLFKDLYDIKYKNDMILRFDVEDKLSDVTAKALIFANADNFYYSYEYDALPLRDLIKDSKVVLYDSLKDSDNYLNYSIFTDDLEKFLEEFKK